MTSKQELRAEIAEWQAAYGRLAREYVDATERVVLPADQYDKLMAEADQADEAPKLAEAAVKPRAFESGGMTVTAKYGDPGTILINGCAQQCSGNPDVRCDTEHGTFPNIARFEYPAEWAWVVVDDDGIATVAALARTREEANLLWGFADGLDLQGELMLKRLRRTKIELDEAA